MDKNDINEKLQVLENNIREVQKLYQKLEESYSLNKAFIDTQSDESIKNIVNKQLEQVKTKTQEAQEMIDELKESYEFIATIQNNGKNRIQYIQEILTDSTLKDIDNKLQYFKNTYDNIFYNQDGDLMANFLNKYKEINQTYEKLYFSYGNQKSKIDKLDDDIKDFFDKYNEIIMGNEEHISKYDILNKVFDDFNDKKAQLDDFYIKIFGDNENINSLQKELENRQCQLKEIEQEAKRVIELSSDAGLASGFHQQVKSARSNKRIALFVFSTILVIMGWFNFSTIDFENLQNIDLASVVVRLMINIPFIWVATVANINLNKYTKLEQEYAHKESLAKSFERYKEEIEKLNNGHGKENELMEKLMGINLEAFRKNPADSIEKIKSDGFFKMLLKNKETQE